MGNPFGGNLGLGALAQLGNMYQQRVALSGYATTGTAVTATWLPATVGNYTISQNFDVRAPEPKKDDSLAWLDRRVEEMRVKL